MYIYYLSLNPKGREDSTIVLRYFEKGVNQCFDDVGGRKNQFRTYVLTLTCEAEMGETSFAISLFSLDYNLTSDPQTEPNRSASEENSQKPTQSVVLSANHHRQITASIRINFVFSPVYVPYITCYYVYVCVYLL